MRKFLLLTGSLLLAAALGLGGWWAWPILFPPGASGWLSTLAKADAALVQDRPDLARKILDEPPATLGVAGWLQWDKRVFAVANRTGAWDWAEKAARAGQAQFPGNPDLAALVVWCLSRQGKAGEASALAEKVLPKSTWGPLADQVRIEAAGWARGDWSDLRQKLADPGPASGPVYGALATLVSDPGIRRNALLSALAAGRLDEARQLLDGLSSTQRDQPPFDRLQALMAYDQGDWARAAALLKNLPKDQSDHLLLLADVYLHLGDRAQARIIYDQMAADHPDDLPLALGLNRAALALEDREPDRALELLTRTAQAHPDLGPEAVRLPTLEARFQNGETEAVRQALDRLIAEGQESEGALDAELLKGRLFPEWTSVPRLWSLLHRHPASQPLAERLAWTLLAAQDTAGCLKVLGFHDAALAKAGEPPTWWTPYLRALAASLDGRWADAQASFDAVPTAWRDASFWADWALVAAVQAQEAPEADRRPLLENALERLSRGLDLLPPQGEAAGLVRRSLWLTRRGELRVTLLPLELPAQRGALRSAAAEDFRQAVRLDPANLRASFLLRQSEATNQEKS